MTTYAIKDTSNSVLRIETSNTPPIASSGETVVVVSSLPPTIPRGKTLKLIGANYQVVDDRNLSDLKIVKNAEINAARLAANETSFSFGGKEISCDRLSRSDIDGINGIVTLTGSLPSGFPMAWKAIDNTYVAIPDKATWTAFYGAMVAQGTANFNKSQSLKTQLAAATTNDQVDAITW